MTCANVAPVARYIDPDDPRVTAHRMPFEVAGETLQDLITTAGLLMDAIGEDAPLSVQEGLRQTGRDQAEAYLDLMAEAATLSRKLKP